MVTCTFVSRSVSQIRTMRTSPELISRPVSCSQSTTMPAPRETETGWGILGIPLTHVRQGWCNNVQMSTVLSQDLTHSTPGTVSQDSELCPPNTASVILTHKKHITFSGLQAKSDTKVLVLRGSLQAMATCMLAPNETPRRTSKMESRQTQGNELSAKCSDMCPSSRLLRD